MPRPNCKYWISIKQPSWLYSCKHVENYAGGEDSHLPITSTTWYQL
jgi:hypothetical protein